MQALVTNKIFESYLECKTKAYLISIDTAAPSRELDDWQQRLKTNFGEASAQRLSTSVSPDDCFSGTPPLDDIRHHRFRLILNCTLRINKLQSVFHALELIAKPGQPKFYAPIRFLTRETITQHDKLLLGFDALVLSALFNSTPRFGKLIHGDLHRSATVHLTSVIPVARRYVHEAIEQLMAQPTFQLNRHCPECVFRTACRQTATEKDDLSLLSKMTERELKNQHHKGIFTVTQLSYTFRPRRRAEKMGQPFPKYNHALKALAIRENKIYVTACPKLQTTGGPLVYLDVEGVPDRAFYYLVGVRVVQGDSCVDHVFWANCVSDEQTMWAGCLRILLSLDRPQIVCYGDFDLTFLRRMKTRYPDVGTADDIDRLIGDAINLLSQVYARIYFPTYSNGLKDVASYLGYRWTYPGATGRHALMWRSQWEQLSDAAIKDRLIVYNADDRAALELVMRAVINLTDSRPDSVESGDPRGAVEVVQVDSLKREYPQHFGVAEFVLPELTHINRCAYWDYQRQKVYARSSKAIKRTIRKAAKRRSVSTLPLNRGVEVNELRPEECPRCGATLIYKFGWWASTVYDLKFTRTGVKRWIVKYRYHLYFCWKCKKKFQLQRAREKYGIELRAFILYFIIELRLPQAAVAQCLRQLFGFEFSRGTINRIKGAGARYYQDLYDQLLAQTTFAAAINADETKVAIDGKEVFVWVFTNAEQAVYVHSDSRDGTVVANLLKDFKGVLISDFYAVYDSVSCPSQKCLIHLIRDLNDALLKEPFNDELRTILRRFTDLLTPIIKSVDRFGLKARHLRKHKRFVRCFYKWLSKSRFSTETANICQRRFLKNRDMLFTFLDYDGVPWNNNNAEHAIKAFVFLRNVIGGTSSEKGMREYLSLLSVCQTCKLKGIQFLDFLRSGAKSFERFRAGQRQGHFDS